MVIIQPGENLTDPITERQAESLLRNDLCKNYALFRKYGADRLLLGCVSYNCGCASLLGNSNKQAIATFFMICWISVITKVKDIPISFVAAGWNTSR